MLDSAYANFDYRLSELPHHYGKQVHLLADPVLLTELLQLCRPQTLQPQITHLVRDLYQALCRQVLAAVLPRHLVQAPTRMQQSCACAVWQGSVVVPTTQVVTVDVARAGTLPSQVVFETLLRLLEPQQVRQDHLFMNRVVDAQGRVVDVAVSGNKIGGPVADSLVLLPDPMGATGGSLARAVDIYKALPGGPPKKIVALHLIVTPEYLAHLTQTHPDVEIFAVRLDRGMSPDSVFHTQLGEHPQHERGLDARHYIVPGAGGLGEILNNSFV
jgi:uracil phosphoribosyltransferase